MSLEYNPFFSVIVPVYNKEPHVSRAIKSVLSQTFKEFELIIVCDPSTDGSNIEVNKFSDPRISVYYRDQPGPGGYAARNLGVKKSKAKWVCFLDADDEWLNDHLEFKAKYIGLFPDIDIFSGSWVKKNKGYEQLDDLSLCHKDNVVLDTLSYLRFEVDNKRAIFTSTLSIKRQLVIDNPFPSGKINMGGDVDTWIRCVFHAEKVYFINRVLAYYHTDSVSMVTKSSCIDPSLHTETTSALLKLALNTEMKKYLHLRLNGLVIYAWKNNCLYCKSCNFSLYRKLDYRAIKIKWGFYIFLSFFPKFFCKSILSFKNE